MEAVVEAGPLRFDIVAEVPTAEVEKAALLEEGARRVEEVTEGDGGVEPATVEPMLPVSLFTDCTSVLEGARDISADVGDGSVVASRC